MSELAVLTEAGHDFVSICGKLGFAPGGNEVDES
jgi:hypothetical protein